MSMTTKVTEKGQTTIPQNLREKYGIDPGDEVEWIETDDGLLLKKVADDGGRGMLLDDDVPREKREEVAEELSEEIREMRDTEWAVE
jgi:AbrB family looped-hinge helix DNA binding protein